MAEIRLPYDLELEAKQQEAVKLSTQGQFNRAEGILTQAIDDIHAIEGDQAPLESLTNSTHLARLHRDLGLNSLRFAGVTWKGQPARNSALLSAQEQLGAANGHHARANTASPLVENHRFASHLKAEQGATLTAESRLLGFQLLAAREAGNGAEASFLEKAMSDKFAWAQANYEAGDNAFYKVNGALVEAMYLRTLLGRSPLEKVRYAMRITKAAERAERAACGASLARRTLEIAFRATPETLLRHV